MKSFTGDFIWSSVEHGRAEEKFYEKEYYLKSEADKAIAYLQKQLVLARTSLIKSLAQAQHEAHHNKYKRCRAMAEWCDAEADFVEAYGNYDDMRWCQKWHQKWLELAKQFNSTDQ